MKSTPDTLLTKFLHGKCSPKELRLLLQYFGNSVNEQELKEIIQKISQQIDDQKEPAGNHQVIITEVYQKISSQIRLSGPKPFKRLIWPGIAATILFGALLLSILGRHFFYRDTPLQLVITKNAQHKMVRLPDGTQVWLGPLSKLKFPEIFSGGTRQIQLEGEAYFEVVKDKTHPFIIKDGSLTTRVVGTSFTIKSHHIQKTITITVLTGKVSVTAKTGENAVRHVELTPYQRVVYTPGKHTLVKEHYPDANEILGERMGNYEFKGTPVIQVLEEAKRQYGVDINASNINKCTFYGDLKTNESIEDFLKKLCLVINATWYKKNNSYIISTPGC